ncbi:MAG: hypothetical protein GY768_33055 [Planctomycetaceae bacterium]|nr:hypothetical protein [Planctomycetaceae bacterium]
MTVEQLVSFFGWCTVINGLVVLVWGLAIMTMSQAMAKVHARMLHVSEQQMMPLYLQWISQYKLLILVFNLAPYLALKIMVSG